MRFAHAGLLFCLGLLAGCSGKKQETLPDPVEFEGKITGAQGKLIFLRFKALDENIAKKGKDMIDVGVNSKTGEFKGKAIPGQYEVTAQPVVQGVAGGTAGPGTNSVGPASQPTPLGKHTIPAEGTKSLNLTLR